MSLNSITVFRNNCRGNVANTSYPHRVEVHSAEDLQKAAAFDHVCAAYADGKNKHGNTIRAHRSIDTFFALGLPANGQRQRPYRSCR